MIPQINNQINTEDLLKDEQIPSKTYRLNLDVPTTLKTIGEPATKTGNPITINEKFSDPKLILNSIDGESEQDSTTGKNKLVVTDTAEENIVGIKYSVDKGIVHINGTSYNYKSFYQDSFQVLTGTYTFSTNIKGYTDKDSGNSSVILQQSDNNVDFSTLVDLNMRSTNIKKETVSLNSSKYYRLRIYVEASCVFTNAEIKTQLEEGSNQTEWERYTGGEASPNPNYPQDIKTVQGIDNLFDESVFEEYEHTEEDDCYVFAHDTLLRQNLTPNVTFEENTQYVFQYIAKQETGNPRLQIKYTDNTYTDISPISTVLTKYTLVSEPNKTIANITMNYGSGGSNTFYIKKNSCQLEKGTTVHPFVPWGNTDPEYAQYGANKFDGELELGGIGSNGANISNSSCIRSKNYIKAEPNKTYTLSDNNQYTINIYEYDVDKNLIKNNSSSTITTNERTKYIRFRTNVTLNQNDLTTKFMLNEGSTPLPYETYGKNSYLPIIITNEDETKETTALIPIGNRELAEVGDIPDECYVDLYTGEVVKEHYVGKYILNGTENWTLQNGIFVLTVSNALKVYYGDEKVRVISNYFKGAKSNYRSNLNDLTIAKIIDNSQNQIGIKYTEISTANDFKTFLSEKYDSENPVIMYYVLATPYEEVIGLMPPEELAKLRELKLYMGTTNISLEDYYDLKPNIEVGYYPEGTVTFKTETKDRILGYTDDLGAVKQAIYHILQTERYAYIIYDRNYGVELEQYIGQSFEYLKTTIQQTLTEALTQDLRINSIVVNDVVQIEKDKALVSFTANTIYGNLVLEVNVNV